MSQRSGLGLALVVVVMVGLVLAAVLAAQAYLASGSASAVQRLARAEQARALAESAIEEALASLSRDANGASGTGAEAWTKFRVKAESGFDLAIPLNRLESLNRELARYPLCQQPPPEVTARVRFQRWLDTSTNPLHDQRFGTLELTAAVSYQLDRTIERRTSTRWFEFKVVHTTLPNPFDHTLVYIHDAGKIVNANALVKASEPPYANLLMFDAASALERAPIDLDGWIARLEGELQGAQQLAGTSPRAGAVAAKLQAGIAALRSRRSAADAALARYQASVAKIVQMITGDDAPFLFGFPMVALAQAERSGNVLLLNDFNLPAINRKLSDRRNVTKLERDNRVNDFDLALQDLYSQLLGTPGSGADLGAACAALSAAIEKDVDSASAVLTTFYDYQTRLNVRSGDAELRDKRANLDLMGLSAWTNAAAASGADPVLTPGKAQFAIPKALCVDAAAMGRELGALLDRYGPPFQGTIHLDNAGGAELVLDGDADARWRGYAGRLTLVTTGKCRLKNVTRGNPAQHLLTVISHGDLNVSGTVQASLVAFARFLHPPGTETVIQGHLLLDRAAHELANDADVEAVLANVKMVPDVLQPTTGPGDTIKGDRIAVLFGPAPVYARAPRQEEK